MNFEFGLTLSILQKFKLGQLFALKKCFTSKSKFAFCYMDSDKMTVI